MRDSNRVVQSLWIGSDLSALERLSIQSFLRNGHKFVLFTYGDVGNVPEGTTVKDANKIIDLSDLHYKDFPKLALFADFFRYKLLMERGGWWVDTDTVCLRPFDFESEYVFSSEDQKKGPHINNGMIKVPAKSEIMRWCWEKCLEMEIPNMVWGSSGPSLMKTAIENFELENHVCSPQTFCPIPWWDVEKLPDPDVALTIPRTAYAVHLWGNLWKGDRETFLPGSLYAKLKDGLELNYDPLFIVRMHSEMPWAAINGLYSGFTTDNLQLARNAGVIAAAQSLRMANDMSLFMPTYHLPSYFSLGPVRTNWKEDPEYDDVACFGALRMLKNHSVQAVAALRFAKCRGKKLRFHLNDYCDEAYGKNIISLLSTLFSAVKGAELVIHPMVPYPTFLELLSTMTIGLQVSMTESTNSVSLDMASVGLPMVCSSEIKWIANKSRAYPTDSEEITLKMLYAMEHPELVDLNRRKIEELNVSCFRKWQAVLGSSFQGSRILTFSKNAAVGVQNSSNQDYRMLLEHGVEAFQLRTDMSASEIRKGIAEYKPTHVIFESTWEGLQNLYADQEEKPEKEEPRRAVPKIRLRPTRGDGTFL